MTIGYASSCRSVISESLHLLHFLKGLQYCFNLTNRGQYSTADEILRHIIVSNAYQARERQDSIRLALISRMRFNVSLTNAEPLSLLACAIHAERHDVVVEQCRKLITHHQFNNEPLRILVASLASGLRNTDAFITSTLQKHLFREMKSSDTAVKNPSSLKWNPLNKRYAPKGGSKSTAGADEVEGEEDEEIEGGGVEEEYENASNSMVMNNEKTSSTSAPPLPTRENPLIIAMYGQICIAAKSYQSAICMSLFCYNDNSY